MSYIILCHYTIYQSVIVLKLIFNSSDRGRGEKERHFNIMFLLSYLLINLSEPFFDTNVGPRPNLARMYGWRRDWLSPKKLTNPTPEGFRGLFMFVACGFVRCLWVGCLWVVCGMIQAGGR